MGLMIFLGIIGAEIIVCMAIGIADQIATFIWKLKSFKYHMEEERRKK